MAKSTSASVSAAGQKDIKTALSRLWNISPCRATATENAEIWKAVFGRKSYKGENWSAWVDPNAVPHVEEAAG